MKIEVYHNSYSSEYASQCYRRLKAFCVVDLVQNSKDSSFREHWVEIITNGMSANLHFISEHPVTTFNMKAETQRHLEACIRG